MKRFAFFPNLCIFIGMNTVESDAKLRWKKRRKEDAVELLGGKCEICGYNKCLDALDFHHVGDDKDFNIAQALPRWKWSRIVAELKKCTLVCANCHREIHSKKIGDHSLRRTMRQWHKMVCPTCKKEFETKHQNRKHCSIQCLTFSQRRAERPSEEELRSLLETTSWTQIGKMFGVSDNAVRKWAKRYGII
jgi:hypothetical protein